MPLPVWWAAFVAIMAWALLCDLALRIVAALLSPMRLVWHLVLGATGAIAVLLVLGGVVAIFD